MPKHFELTPPPAPDIPETDVSKQFVTFLRRQGFTVLRNHVGLFVPYATAMQALEALIDQMVRGEEPRFEASRQLVKSQCVTINEPGMSDLLAIPPRTKLWWIEVKRLGESMEPHQRLFAERRRLAGDYAGVWDSLDSLRAYYYCKVAQDQ